MGPVGVGGAAAVGGGVPPGELVARQGVAAAGERGLLPVEEFLVAHRSRNLRARPARGVGVEVHGVGVGIPLRVQRHGRPVLARQVGDLGPVGVGVARAVRRGVPPREAVALARERALAELHGFVRQDGLGCHLALAAVGVERYRVGVVLPLRVERDAAARLVGQVEDRLSVGVGLPAAVRRGVPADEVVVGAGELVGRERRFGIEADQLGVHRARVRTVGIEDDLVGQRLPLRVQRHGRSVLGGEVRNLGPVGVGGPRAVRCGVPAGEAVALALERAGGQRLRLVVGHLQIRHRAAAVVGVEGDLVGVGSRVRRKGDRSEQGHHLPQVLA